MTDIDDCSVQAEVLIAIDIAKQAHAARIRWPLANWSETKSIDQR